MNRFIYTVLAIMFISTNFLLSADLSLVQAGDHAYCTNDALSSQQFISSTGYSANIDMYNDGTTTWTSAAGYKLGPISPGDESCSGTCPWGDRSGITTNQGTRPGRVSISGSVPGSQTPPADYNFPVTGTAPATVGFYSFNWRVLNDTTGTTAGECYNDVKVWPPDGAVTLLATCDSKRPAMYWAVTIPAQWGRYSFVKPNSQTLNDTVASGGTNLSGTDTGLTGSTVYSANLSLWQDTFGMFDIYPKSLTTLSYDDCDPYVFTLTSPGNLNLINGTTDTGRSITITKTGGYNPATAVTPVILQNNGGVGDTITSSDYTFSSTSCTPSPAAGTGGTCAVTLTFRTTSNKTFKGLSIHGSGALGGSADSTPFDVTIGARPPSLINITSCSGAANGQTVTWTARDIAGGNGIYTYTWADGTSTPPAGETNITRTTSSSAPKTYPPGTYTGSVTVTDDAGNSSGSVSCGSVTVASTAPTVSLSANPTNIINGSGSTTLSWTVSNATSCSYTNSGDTTDISPANAWTSLSSNASGSKAISLANSSSSVHSVRFTLTCNNGGGTPVSQFADVTIQPVGGSTFNFTLTNPNPNSITLTQTGAAGVTGITITKSGAPDENITLSIDPNNTQLPVLATSVFSSCSSYPCNSALTITPHSAAAGAYNNIRIKGLSSITGITQISGPFSLTINLPAAGGAPVIGPWIQVTGWGGDVHSNVRINTTGGP